MRCTIVLQTCTKTRLVFPLGVLRAIGIPRLSTAGAIGQCLFYCLLVSTSCNYSQPVYDVQVKYGSKVTNRNVNSTLFITGEQSLITGAKMDRLLLSADSVSLE